MYIEYLDVLDYKEMQEDIAKLVIGFILKDDVLRVLMCLLRIDCFDQDKDLRAKYSMLKGVQTTDFGIDPYLSMNNADIFFQEIIIKFELRNEQRTSIVNSTVQAEYPINDAEIHNYGFKDFLRENKQIID